MKINLLTWQSNLTSGGIQNTAYLLAEEMTKSLGDDFILFEESNSIQQDGVNTVLMPYKSWWRFYLETFRYMKKTRISEYNLCMLWMCGISAYIYKKIYGIPYGVMIYGNDVIEAQGESLKRKLKNKVRKIVLKNADTIFSCSNYSLDLVRKITNNKNLCVIHPPVLFRETDSFIKTDNDSHIVFSIGRHVERKGFQDVIQAISILKNKYSDIMYRIAGDGPYHNKLKFLVKKLDLEKHVTFLGRISEEEKVKEFRKCSIFVMTSHEEIDNMEVEGFGIVYIEANMYGKWVLACNSGGVSDAVIDGKTGTLIEEPNPSLISKKIDEFFSGEIKVDSNNLIEWSKEFSPQTIANQYLSEIRKTVRTKN